MGNFRSLGRAPVFPYFVYPNFDDPDNAKFDEKLGIVPVQNQVKVLR